VFETLTVLAPGLLGGSVAMAAGARGLARRLHVWSRRAETRESLRQVPWCDEVFDDPDTAVAGAGLVVVCAPVEHIAPLVERVASALAPGALVTDVGSVKGEICRHCTAAVAAAGRGQFVGSHPMAGSDRVGHAHADADLFRGRACFVTPLADTPPAAVERIAAFWRALEAVVVQETPERHDEIVAHISHLPHLLASTLCSLLAQRDPRWRELAGPGLRDTTRIAGSDADLWRGILDENREQVLEALARFQDEIGAMRAALSARDAAAVRAILERGREYRAGLRA
jgi:cyclohexadieny/prephenate dehydrogenase